MANLGFILKQSVMDACNTMNDAEFREMITALFNYAVKGKTPELTTELQKVVFSMEKPAIEYNNSKWARKNSREE